MCGIAGILYADPQRPDWPEAAWRRLGDGAPALEGAALTIACRRERALEVAGRPGLANGRTTVSMTMRCPR